MPETDVIGPSSIKHTVVRIIGIYGDIVTLAIESNPSAGGRVNKNKGNTV